MKTFKQFLKGTKIPVIPVPIHFKHVKRLKNVIPSIPMPIDFRYVNLPKKAKKKIVREDTEHEHPHIKDWAKHDDNEHLHDPDSKLTKPDQVTASLIHGSAKHENKHHEAIRSYTRSSSHLNEKLHKGEPLESFQHNLHKHLSEAIDKHRLHRLTKDLHAYSGVGFDPSKHINKDGHMHSPAYISATHNKALAPNFSYNQDGKKHIIHFHLKKGDPATHVDHISTNRGEHETIIQHGTTLKHLGTKVYKGGSDKIPLQYHIHHMEIAHDKK